VKDGLMTARLQPDEGGLARAVDLLRQGSVVAFPTETVYGLGGDATNDRAIARIFDAKARPRFNPLIVHLPDLEAASRFADVTPRARALAQRF
jgi:L-threonylcarbamoyladenylate synthase